MIRWIKKKLRNIKVVEDHNEVSAERNSLKDQQSESEKRINGFEYQIRSKDDEIRLLEHRLALKDEKMRHLKRQLDLREKESASLRIAIQSACTNLGSAVTAADDAFKFTNKNPPEKAKRLAVHQTMVPAACDAPLDKPMDLMTICSSWWIF